MKKLIDIPEEIVKDLKKMAIDADKDLKKLHSRPFGFTCEEKRIKNFHKCQIEAVR